MSAELTVVAPAAANDPKVTEGFFCSVAELVLLVVLGVTTAAGCPNEKPVLFVTVSAGLLTGEPKLNPPVVVVEVTVSELFVASGVVDLEPKLNPPEPKVAAAAVVGSFFSLVLELSVLSEEAAGLMPKLNPLPVAGAAVVATATALPLLPKLNLGLSSELAVLVVDVTVPKLNPVPAEVVALADELAGTPKENPVVLGASFPSES